MLWRMPILDYTTTGHGRLGGGDEFNQKILTPSCSTERR